MARLQAILDGLKERVRELYVFLFKARISAFLRKLTRMARIRLYINGSEVDCGSAESLLLFTYAASDLDAPAVVQNSYSKEVVLPPTQRNAQVFGAMWRADKIAGASDAFRALDRTPFEIRNNANEIMESGYCKLEKASAKEGYTLTLYGGLGAFLYGLMYNDDGSKKSLADLTWGSVIDAGLSFNISAAIVQAAWNRLQSSPQTIASPYDVVNFAPMHNGLPSDFDCGKGLVPVGGAHGCTAISGQSGITIDGVEYALVDFGGEDYGEWDVRDLRSYLQRPVVSMKAVLTALEDATNNGGYTFDWSAVSGLDDINCWMTLPMLSVEGQTQEGVQLTPTWGATAITNINNGLSSKITFAESIPTTSKVDVSIGANLRLRYTIPTGMSPDYGSLNG